MLVLSCMWQGGQSHGQHDWDQGYTEPAKSFITFIILDQISCRKVQKPPHIFCTRLSQKFSWVCCSFQDYLKQLRKKNGKFSAIGFTLQLFKVIWKLAMNPEETITLSCAEKYEGVCTLPHEIWLRITKVMYDFSLPVMSEYWFVKSVNPIRQTTWLATFVTSKSSSEPAQKISEPRLLAYTDAWVKVRNLQNPEL